VLKGWSGKLPHLADVLARRQRIARRVEAEDDHASDRVCQRTYVLCNLTFSFIVSKT
jgi:hypothetical protein